MFKISDQNPYDNLRFIVDAFLIIIRHLKRGLYDSQKSPLNICLKSRFTRIPVFLSRIDKFKLWNLYAAEKEKQIERILHFSKEKEKMLNLLR